MNIYDEFESLKTLALTPDGWMKIDQAFSDTDRLLGFAMMKTTVWKYEIGTSRHLKHKQVMFDLARRLAREEKDAKIFSRMETEMFEGRIAPFSETSFGLVLIEASAPILEQVEPIILEMKIGLPVGLLFHKHNIHHDH